MVFQFIMIGNDKRMHLSLTETGNNHVFFFLLSFSYLPSSLILFFPKLFQLKLPSKTLTLLWSLLLMEAILVFWRESGRGSPLTWTESSSSLCRPWLSTDRSSQARSSLGASYLNHHMRQLSLVHKSELRIRSNEPAGGKEVQNDMQKLLFWGNKTL